MANTYKNPYVGKAVTPAGIMPEDKLVRFKLKAEYNTPGDVSRRRDHSGNRKIKKMFEGIKHYRQMAHGCQEKRLPSALRLAVHSLLVPITKGRDADKGAGSRNFGVVNQDNDDSLAAVKTPMKV